MSDILNLTPDYEITQERETFEADAHAYTEKTFVKGGIAKYSLTDGTIEYYICYYVPNGNGSSKWIKCAQSEYTEVAIGPAYNFRGTINDNFESVSEGLDVVNTSLDTWMGRVNNVAYSGNTSDLQASGDKLFATVEEKTRWGDNVYTSNASGRLALMKQPYGQSEPTDFTNDFKAGLEIPTLTSQLTNDTQFVTNVDSSYSSPAIYRFANVTVEANAFVTWEGSTTQTTYRAPIVLTKPTGVTDWSLFVPKVMFSSSDSSSSSIQFAQICESYTDGVYIYSVSKPSTAITIPEIILTKPAN